VKKKSFIFDKIGEGSPDGAASPGKLPQEMGIRGSGWVEV